MSDNTLAQETIPAGEAQYTADLAARLKAKIIRDNPTGIMRRDAHPKMHGVVKAEFTVEADLPAELRVGIFAEARTYQAWIRYSNQDGTIQADKARDIRGMAIKLMGVPGDKLLESERHEQTQDFIVISTNVFVTKNVEEFDALIKAMTGSILSKIFFFATHWRVIWNLVTSLKKFANPLQMRYWSTTPYLFGNTAVKYSAIPHVRNPDPLPSDPGPDYLRQAMVRQLAQGEALFDFTVQLQTNADNMPIEDPGKEWKESESPFRKVATIRILQQEFDSEAQRVFGENLSYTPWHSLPAHRPLGGINRARKIVYDAISTFRHEYNKVARKEPASWDI
ncbi:MAG: catalase family protein [Burkholderiaceae bacterium]|uniref:Catalase family protein n=1 Tax=Herminiimonas contaminans TaxID=1111140 RepID=A0ABS0EXR5_9BURK|nr:catalase family protein [Herminiimonas contaminans]MBF8179611.1 catalase family protein [Herminiimonas contaminans]MBX9799849.1 catalase family protein [Burkholderiaceae bacterium]